MSRRWENCPLCRETVERVTDADGSPARVDVLGGRHVCFSKWLLNEGPAVDVVWEPAPIEPGPMTYGEAQGIVARYLLGVTGANVEREAARRLLEGSVRRVQTEYLNGGLVRRVWFDGRLVWEGCGTL